MRGGAIGTLRAEFDRLADAGRTVGFWWRDDDAVAAGPALDRLLDLTARRGLPISLAVIPRQARESLAVRIRTQDAVTVLVHGWDHANHAPPAERKAEFGSHRPASDMASEVRSGLASITELFGRQALPVFVPPWNRIAPDLVARLPDCGYRALSCFGEARSTAGTCRIDTHLDPVDWRGSRSLVEPRALVEMTRRALHRGTDVIGLLTHHLVFDEALWSFCAEMADLASDHPALEPLDLAAILAEPRRAARFEEAHP